MAIPRIVPVLLAAFLSVPAVSLPRAVAGDGKPAGPADALASARAILEPVRTLPAVVDKNSKDHTGIADAVHKALGVLKAQSKEGFRDPQFQGMWNDAVSLGWYHRLKGVPPFQLEPKGLLACPVRMGLPVGRGWSLKSMTPSPGKQQVGEVTRVMPDNRLSRVIKVWLYQWTTVYSGVGGENAKGLAESDMAHDREGMKKVSFRSNRIVTTRLSAGFPKTSYYEIVGDDEEHGPVRRRNYYVKGSTTTYNFEVIEVRKTEPSDSPWVRWQLEEGDPELDAVLESLEDAPAKGK